MIFLELKYRSICTSHKGDEAFFGEYDWILESHTDG